MVFCQEWTVPEIIYENPHQGYSCLSAVIDDDNTINLVWSTDCDKDQNADSLYYLKLNGSSILNPISMKGDSIILTLATAIGADQKVHIIWGDRRSGYISPNIQKIYYSRIENMTWFPPILVAELDETNEKVVEIKLISQPDSSLLAFWGKSPHFTIYFSCFEQEYWSSRFIPFHDYSFESKKGYFGRACYPDIIKDKHATLQITFEGTTGDQAPPVGASFISQINYIENDPYNKNWENVIPRKIDHSTSVYYHQPKIAVTDENIRYISWLVDRDFNVLPDGIYYSYSRNGETWTEPKSIIKFKEEFILNQSIVADHSGNIHVLWTRYVFGSGPIINYAVIHEENCIRQELPVFDYRRQPHSKNLLIDPSNHEHLYWVEFRDESDTSGIVIKHTWRDLTTEALTEKLSHGENEESSSIFITTYPNPFNESTTLKIELAKPSRLTVTIYNMNGQLVRTLLSQLYVQAKVQAQWNGINQNGALVSSGIYFYVVKIKRDLDERDHQVVGKLILLR
jgi:hypothetical protein